MARPASSTLGVGDTVRCSGGSYDTRTRCDCRAGADRVQPPTFDGSASLALFHGKFEAAADHNMWTSSGKAADLFAVSRVELPTFETASQLELYTRISLGL